MTTIATDGKTIAADGQGTLSYGVIARRFCKKIIVRGGHIFALTGSDALTPVMAKWHEDGADPDKLPKYNDATGWTLLVITQNKFVVYSSECPHPSEIELPYALGMGGEMALGAMLHGATPREAVEIVASRTNHTGGEIMEIDIAAALAQPALPLAIAAE